MLRELGIERFKSIKEAKLEFAPLTTLVGPNGSGKSSCLEALASIRQNVENSGAFTFDGSLVKLGRFEDVVFRHKATKPINFSLSFDVNTEVNGFADEGQLRQLQFKLSIGKDHSIIREIKLMFDKGTFSLKVSSSYDTFAHRWVRAVDPDVLALTSNEQSMLNFKLAPKQAQGTQLYQKFVSALEFLKDLIRKMYYLSISRGLASLYGSSYSMVISDYVGVYGENLPGMLSTAS